VKAPLRLGIIGCGRVAFHHADMLKGIQAIKLAACCDLVEDKAQKLAEMSGVPAYTNYHQMLKQEDLDVVALATPTGAHYEHVRDILEQKPIHILLEKPMVLRIAHGLQLKALAEKKGVKIFPVYQNRLNKAVGRVKSAWRQGSWGTLF
jgi:predicted dehydrogenase